ncbi:RE1, partial [Symbiodinium sp. CCMP2456]
MDLEASRSPTSSVITASPKTTQSSPSSAGSSDTFAKAEATAQYEFAISDPRNCGITLHYLATGFTSGAANAILFNVMAGYLNVPSDTIKAGANLAELPTVFSVLLGILLMVEYAKGEPLERRGRAQTLLQMFHMTGYFISLTIVAFGFTGRMFTGSFSQLNQLSYEQAVAILAMVCLVTGVACIFNVQERPGGRSSIRGYCRSSWHLLESKVMSPSGATAADDRWFTRLGEFVRQATVISQSRPGIEATVVQETVFSPGGTRRDGGAGSTAVWSETSDRGSFGYLGSYTKEQLESEVVSQANVTTSMGKGFTQHVADEDMGVSMGVFQRILIVILYQEADEQAAINVGDWLHGLAGPMGDLTDGSSKWWAEVMMSLDRLNQDYMSVPTVRKVQLRAEDYATAELRDSKWLRLDKRAASMLLQAVPESLKNELMASRLSTTIGILGLILVIYRPGSAAERQQVLRALENPGSGSTASDLVEVLRKWMRWLRRAQDLGLQVPDASILLKGLDTAARPQLEKNPEVVFRSNMMRFSLDLDSAPNLDNILRYHGRLLAEFEQLSFRGRTRTSGVSVPVVKNVNASTDVGGSSTPKTGTSPSAGSTSKPCKFYLSDTGCQRQKCKFVHDWQSVPREDRNDKCKGCGGRGHLKRSCPMRQDGDGSGKGDSGKGSGQPRVKNMSQDKREDGTMPSNDTTTSSTTSTGPMTTSSNSTASGSGPPTMTSAGASNEDFLKSATQILKMMAEQSASAASTSMPSMKMLKKAVTEMEARMALVDSGATHPLRKARVPEWERAPEVDVVVAGDSVAKMRQNETGTLLTSPGSTSSQTILPVGSLVKILGYELVWTRRKCTLRAPDGREIPLRISSGCPEISEATALDLIAKIEEEKVTQLREKAEITRVATLRSQGIAQSEQWESCMKEYVSTGKFEDGFRAMVSMPWLCNVPREDLVKVVMDIPSTETEAWELMKAVGFNRRMRKRLIHKDWVLKLYSGRRSQADKILRPMESNNTVVLDVDELRNSAWDVLKDGSGIYELLLWGAATGRIAGVLAALPREQSTEHLLRLMTMIEVANQGRKEMCRAVDIPNDGVAVSLWASSEAEEDLSAQAFQKEWFKKWIMEAMLDKLHFEQGGLGHPSRRPTTMVTNMDITELRGVRDERKEESTWGTWSTWAPMMLHILARGWKRWKLRPGWYPRMVKALKEVDRKAWERHLANDHVPHRPDCVQCIHNSTGRPHRRCLRRDCYVMSADTLGPVRIAGPKGEKYALVFTYQYPKQKLGTEDEVIKDEDLDGWDLDVDVELAEGDSQGEAGNHEEEAGEDNLEEYEPSMAEEFDEPGLPEDDVEVMGLRAIKGKAAEPKEDWWEFRETAGVLIRHHEVPRKTLFRPTAANGCPVLPAKLEDTRITDIKYVGGGVETETSDWQGPKSGARSLPRSWTGTTRFKISAAEVPEDEEVLQRDEEQWEKLIGDLTKPVEMETLYLVYPVRSKRGGDAMLAIQEAVLRLKLLGLPVARLHTDRGSEFASRGLHRWLLDHDIYHTRSEALVPQTNGAAERGVRWFKTRAKVLLAEANIPLKYWTLAMQHAANRRLHERLGLSKPMLLPFGCKVMIRRKVFGNNKKYDLTDRWEEGKYLGMSDTIKGGAVVLRSSGILTETLNLRTGVVDPRALLAAHEDDGGGVFGPEEVPLIDLPEADHRLRDKQGPPELPVAHKAMVGAKEDDSKKVIGGWRMRTLVERQEQKAKLMYDMGKFDLVSCAEVLNEMDLVGTLKNNKTRGPQVTSMILGAYVHGGMRGVTKAGKRRPHLTKYLNMVLRTRVAEDLGEDGSWTTLGIFKATDIPPHRDLRNQAGSWNYVIEIGSTVSGGLWVAEGGEGNSIRGGGSSQPLTREQPDGKIGNGTLVEIGGRVAAFNAKELHSYISEETERWIVAALTPLGASTLSTSTAAHLSKAADYEVEKILEALPGPLEVVHNVSLPEARRYLERWKGAILKEVDALVSSGTVRRLSAEKARELKSKGMIILPGKAVFTAKPPSDPNDAKAGKYRRKCRIVVCGNYLPADKANVYASGTSADGLRLSVAFAVTRSWRAGATDIANAFTLAPMPGDKLFGMTPPTVVAAAGGAAAGEVWGIERVLYGLREAPRWWGVFRNERLSSARIPMDNEVLILESLETEENMWRIKVVGSDEIRGILLIYVDDLLVLSITKIIETVYKWLTDDWKCSTLQWMDEEHLRFLGVELRPMGQGIHISQAGYIRDLLRQHGVAEKPGALTVPCLLRRPRENCLNYLSKTVEYGLHYVRDEEETFLTVYSDASYAPGGGRSFGCIMAQLAGMPICWRASKQPIITLSVAEAELYEAVSSVQLGLGVEAMLNELGEKPVMHLKIDNAAAQGLASEAPGSWKTRHLRLRARFLRQEVSAQRLTISHVPGDLQKADLGTNSFDVPKFRALLGLWRIVPYELVENAEVVVKTAKKLSNKNILMFAMVCFMMVQGARGDVKEDLQLDSSLEFYVIVGLSMVACRDDPSSGYEFYKGVGNYATGPNYVDGYSRAAIYDGTCKVSYAMAMSYIYPFGVHPDRGVLSARCLIVSTIAGAFCAVALFFFANTSIFNLSTTARTWVALEWAKTENMQRQISGMLAAVLSFVGCWLTQKWFLGVSWRKIICATGILTSLFDSIPQFCTIFDVIRNQYFYLGEPLTQNVPQAMAALVTTFLINELADDSNCALVAGLMNTIPAVGQQLSVIISNQVFSMFTPDLSVRRNYVEDTPEFRWTVASSFLLSYTMSLLCFLTLPLLPMQSFKLAGRLKASQEIIAEHHKVKSWKLWLWLLGQGLTAGLVFWPSVFHSSLSIVMLFLLAAPAFHRDYSALGLAEEQRPARWFLTISMLLRVGVFLSFYPLTRAMHVFGRTPEFVAQDAPNADQQQVSFGAMAFGIDDWLILCLLLWMLFLSRCFCVRNDFSGAAEADPNLQKRIEGRARELSEQMRKSELPPTWKEYVMLHVDILLFVWDFVSDGLAAWKYFELELYGFLVFQIAIIFMTLWEETRVCRRLGTVLTVYSAVAESSMLGWPTDNLLAILMQEKMIEAFPSLMLLSFASSYLPQSGGRQLLGYDITYLWLAFTVFKVFTGIYSFTKAAYVLMHLDLDRHIAVHVERLGLPSAPSTTHSAGIPAQELHLLPPPHRLLHRELLHSPRLLHSHPLLPKGAFHASTATNPGANPGRGTIGNALMTLMPASLDKNRRDRLDMLSAEMDELHCRMRDGAGPAGGHAGAAVCRFMRLRNRAAYWVHDQLGDALTPPHEAGIWEQCFKPWVFVGLARPPWVDRKRALLFTTRHVKLKDPREEKQTLAPGFNTELSHLLAISRLVGFRVSTVKGCKFDESVGSDERRMRAFLLLCAAVKQRAEGVGPRSAKQVWWSFEFKALSARFAGATSVKDVPDCAAAEDSNGSPLLRAVVRFVLQKHSLFQCVYNNDRDTFSRVCNTCIVEQSVDRGHDVFKVGEKGAAMYVVNHGKLAYALGMDDLFDPTDSQEWLNLKENNLASIISSGTVVSE